MTTTMQKQSNSYNQHKLKIICDKLCDNIEPLFDYFGLHELKHNGKMFVGKCPIHDGDNKTAFNIYPDGDSYRGNWKCRTHNCDKYFKSSIIGLIRGLLSSKKYGWKTHGDKTVSFDETMHFIEQFLKDDINSISISNIDIDKRNFSSFVSTLSKTNKHEKIESRVSRNSIRSSLIIPSEYFISRGFSKEILQKYDVGLCNKPEKEMYNRAIAPIYDVEYKYMVGCTGRSIFNKCPSCESHHDPNKECPSVDERWKFPKWKHNHNFKSQNHLYNLWFAKEFILKTGTVILVESPGNVWKLEESGIHNSVALFGSNLSDYQKILLDGSGAMTIMIIMDNDEAGFKATELIKNKCKNTYNISSITVTKSDIAEMTIDEIETEIKNKI